MVEILEREKLPGQPEMQVTAEMGIIVTSIVGVYCMD